MINSAEINKKIDEIADTYLMCNRNPEFNVLIDEMIYEIQNMIDDELGDSCIE
jgi:hypothetical protein